MANANGRFCQVDFLTYESTAGRNIHVLGDAIQPAELMPKSGHMANQHGKVCASGGRPPCSLLESEPRTRDRQHPLCFIDDKEVVHVASVHRYDPATKRCASLPAAAVVPLRTYAHETVSRGGLG
jgi:hypothetical protein